MDFLDLEALHAVDQNVCGVLLRVQDLENLCRNTYFMQVVCAVFRLHVAHHDETDGLGLVFHGLVQCRDLGLAVEDQRDHDAGKGRAGAQRDNRQAGRQNIGGDHQPTLAGLFFDDLGHPVLIDFKVGRQVVVVFIGHAIISLTLQN